MDYSRSAICDGTHDLVPLDIPLASRKADPQDVSNDLQLLKAAVAASQSGIAICSQLGHVLFANQPMGVIFGYAPGELLRRDLRTVAPDASFTVPAAASHRRSLSGQASPDAPSTPRETTGFRKDGAAVPIAIAIRPLPGRSACLFVVSVADLSEQYRLEARADAAETRAKFQAQVLDLATRCAGTLPDDVDAMLDDVVRDLGEALAVDRCIAYLPVDASAASFTAEHQWGRPGCPMPADDFEAVDRLPWSIARARAGETICATTLDDIASPVDRESLENLGARSCAIVPLGINGTRGALVVDTLAERTWAPEAIDGLRLVASVMGQAVARKRERQRLGSGFDELKREHQHTVNENAVLRRETAVQTDRSIASDSVAIRRVLGQVHQVAPTTATVLLLGETGAGKEVFAQAIHNLSPRHRRPMIRVSCAAIPTALIESELFGRERGAFTGALTRQIGRFEAANGSTIFLDEIGDLPLEVQVKLLRVLQERTVERLGGNQSMKVDVRVIAATNRNLETAVANNTFREDLFYRLNVFPITIPPLRERAEDIPSLVWTFIDEFSRAFGKKIDSISKESLAALQRYPWPGNVRELRNVIEREMIVATGPTLSVAAPRALSSPKRAASSKLVDIEVEHITSVLESCRWRVRGAGGAAERLGVKPTTLESRMARLGISREQKSLSE
jgi:formate hydrogenlyase transcriptional activator